MSEYTYEQMAQACEAADAELVALYSDFSHSTVIKLRAVTSILRAMQAQEQERWADGVAWLIETRPEIRAPGLPLYWAGKELWTKDPNEAVRFCRKQDAEAVLSTDISRSQKTQMGWACASDHMWDSAMRVQEQPKARERSKQVADFDCNVCGKPLSKPNPACTTTDDHPAPAMEKSE